MAPHDEDALAEAIVALLRDPALRHRLGAAGRERVVEEFSVDRMVARILDVYQARLKR